MVVSTCSKLVSVLCVDVGEIVSGCFSLGPRENRSIGGSMCGLVGLLDDEKDGREILDGRLPGPFLAALALISLADPACLRSVAVKSMVESLE
jgi:hypothetical protein